MSGRKEIKISCNGVFVASNAAGSNPMDAAFAAMNVHLRDAFDKIMATSEREICLLAVLHRTGGE